MNLNEAKKLLKSTGYILENSFPKEYGIETIIKVMQEHDWSPEFIYSCLKKNDNINDIISRIESVFEKNKATFNNLVNISAEFNGYLDRDINYPISISISANDAKGINIEGWIEFDDTNNTSGMIVWDLENEGGSADQDKKKFQKLTDNIILELLKNLDNNIVNG